jgi:FAD/FMN-containing dehydrogenase
VSALRELIARFGEIVGPQYTLTDPDQQLPYLREWRELYADAHDRLFLLSLPSEGSCQIGGNLATNAGGVGVLA